MSFSEPERFARFERIRWGILATGRIAREFCDDLALLPDHEVAAVGSRTAESAAAFAGMYGGAPYDSYAGVLADPDVDVIYIGTPHSLHAELADAALRAGKPVLCEKPITINYREAESLVALARERGVFLMEAMWMRCNPAIRRLQKLVASGAYGDVRHVSATLGYHATVSPDHRLLAHELGGGALLDIGVYPLNFTRLFLGDPLETTVAAVMTGTIDTDVVIGHTYASGATAALAVSLTAAAHSAATVATDRGHFVIPPPFHHPSTFSWDSGDEVETFDVPTTGLGLSHEADEVARCLRAGETESPLMPLDESLTVMRTLDELRAEIGLVYDADK